MNWRLGIAGSPIAHSLTPQLHEAALAMAGFEGTSRRVELGAKDKTKLNKAMRKEFDGLSITMPLKAFGIEICDEVDDVAMRTRSVNSLLMRDGKLLGASTDGDGFVNALRGQFDVGVEGAHVVVLGSGERRVPSSTVSFVTTWPRSRCTGETRLRSRNSSHVIRTSTTSR